MTRSRLGIAMALFTFGGALAVAGIVVASVAAVPAARREARKGPVIRPAAASQILAAVRAPGARVVVLNVWATWCVPCREEFPDLMRIALASRPQGLRLVLVSADFDDQIPAVRRFLRERGVDFPSYLKTGDDMEFINALNPRWSGALPATFVYDGSGRQVYFHEGRVPTRDLEQAVRQALGNSKGRKKGA
jgi:thiol-disulfide isomerase/thioredoxin